MLGMMPTGRLADTISSIRRCWQGAAWRRSSCSPMRNVANQMTTDQQGVAGQGPCPGHFAVTWIGNMWANINRTGDANEYHSHPGSYWSGTYYVDEGGSDADPELGGELEFLDPRGP